MRCAARLLPVGVSDRFAGLGVHITGAGECSARYTGPASIAPPSTGGYAGHHSPMRSTTGSKTFGKVRSEHAGSEHKRYNHDHLPKNRPLALKGSRDERHWHDAYAEQ